MVLDPVMCPARQQPLLSALYLCFAARNFNNMSDSSDPQNGRAWYALRIRSNQEKMVSSILRNKEIEEFLPLYSSIRRWSDRVKKIDLPLFPGYLFCRLNLRETYLPVLTTPGVVSIAGAGNQPVPVSDEEIESVRTVIRSGLAAMPWPGLTVGSRVLIEHGPLTGLEGIAINVEDQCRLVVSVQLLQRSLAVQIERGWARPIAKPVRTARSAMLNGQGNLGGLGAFIQERQRAAVAI